MFCDCGGVTGEFVVLVVDFVDRDVAVIVHVFCMIGQVSMSAPSAQKAPDPTHGTPQAKPPEQKTKPRAGGKD